MKLDLNPKKTNWPVSHYLFIEKTGPFMQTAPAAWQELHKHLPHIIETYKIKTMAALYKIKPQMIYRAGLVLEEKPAHIPEGMRYETFSGGEYLKFVLAGSYSQLPEACGKVFEYRDKNHIQLRDDFFIEHYTNNPQTTPENDLITEILLPV